MLLLDILLTILHIAIIGFNLFAWIWPKTRRLHILVAGLTVFCWLVPGIWLGFGYCPLTDWQWQVKRQLGQHDLPPSFITWGLLQLTGHRFPDGLVNFATAATFTTAVLLSVYVNYFREPGHAR